MTVICGDKASPHTTAKGSPLICIGRNVRLDIGGDSRRIDRLYVSPGGKIVITATELASEADRIAASSAICSWSCEKLDEIAADYFYETEGQAVDIMDVMARYGYLTFSDAGKLAESIGRSLKESSVVVSSAE